MVSPMGVPGPTRVISSLSSRFNIGESPHSLRLQGTAAGIASLAPFGLNLDVGRVSHVAEVVGTPVGGLVGEDADNVYLREFLDQESRPPLVGGYEAWLRAPSGATPYERRVAAVRRYAFG